MSTFVSAYIRFLSVSFFAAVINIFPSGKIAAGELDLNHFGKDLPLTVPVLSHTTPLSHFSFSGNGSDEEHSVVELPFFTPDSHAPAEYLPSEILDTIFSNLPFDDLVRYRYVSSTRQSFIDHQIRNLYANNRKKLVIDFSYLIDRRKDPAAVIEGALSMLNSSTKEGEKSAVQLALMNFDSAYLLNNYPEKGLVTSKLPVDIFQNVQSLMLSSPSVGETLSEDFDGSRMLTALAHTGLGNVKKLVLQDNTNESENENQDFETWNMHETEVKKLDNFKKFLNTFRSLEKFSFFNNKDSLFLESFRIAVLAESVFSSNLKKFKFQGKSSQINSVALYLSKWSDNFENLVTAKWIVTSNNAEIVKVNSTKSFPALKNDSIKYKKVSPVKLPNLNSYKDFLEEKITPPVKEYSLSKTTKNSRLTRHNKRSHSSSINGSARKKLNLAQ